MTDFLKQPTGLKSKIEKEIQEQKNKLGKIISPLISPVVCTEYNYAIIDSFFRFLKNDKHDIPNKIFFCTSTGFDNNEILSELSPYGTNAAFLWTIYASLKSNKAKSIYIETSPETLIDDNEGLAERLLEDIQELYYSGQAYFDDNHYDEIWHSQNINHLYDNQVWDR